MKRLIWKLYLYFGVVIVGLAVSVAILFTNLNRSNLGDVYDEQLRNLTTNVSSQVKAYSEADNVEGFFDYLSAIEDLGETQNTDIWILANPGTNAPLQEDYTNISVKIIDLPQQTQTLLMNAFAGKKAEYTGYDSIYETQMLHFTAPVYNSSGRVIGAVIINATIEDRSKNINQYQRYLLLSIIGGLLVSIILVPIFIKQISSPILKMKKHALVLAAGNYQQTIPMARKDEIGQLAGSLNVLAEQLAEAEAMRNNMEQNRRDFFSNVSHELRTPITVVKGYAEALVDGYVPDEEKRQDFYHRILKECTGMERLVSDLLALSKMENPEFELQLEVLNIIAVLQDALRGARVMMREKEMRVSIEYEDECSFVKGDYDRIRQLFLILLQNAIKYSEKGTKISSFVTKSEGQIQVTIKDEGVGIDPTEIDQIFDKFYRGHNHHEKDGSGLGLVVAKQIVEKLGGMIYAKSELGKGTEFVVIFMECEPPIE